MEPLMHIEKSTGDRFQIVRRDEALGSIDVVWITGPEKGKTRTYFQNWLKNRCQPIQEKEIAPVF